MSRVGTAEVSVKEGVRPKVRAEDISLQNGYRIVSNVIIMI